MRSLDFVIKKGNQMIAFFYYAFSHSEEER